MMTREWKTSELRIVREQYPTQSAEAIGALIGRTAEAVKCRARRDGLRKPAEFFDACRRKRWA